MLGDKMFFLEIHVALFEWLGVRMSGVLPRPMSVCLRVLLAGRNPRVSRT